ncbi:MAG: hypothetical protein J6D26_02560 [Clostridia bacterium]|nr:hypothetical protein [Clostridia bacterium]
MGDYLSIVEFLSEHNGNLLYLITVLTLGIIAVTVFSKHKDSIFKFITHRRSLGYFLYGVITLAGILLQMLYGSVSIFILITECIIWLAYCTIFVSSYKVGEVVINPVLRKYDMKLNSGLVVECREFFEKEMHWYFWDYGEKLTYTFLRYRFFVYQNDYSSAYKCLEKIDKALLYENEYKDYIQHKATCLVMMGNMKAALEILGDYKQSSSDNPFVWIAYSYIEESAGNIEQAFICAQKAKSLLEKEKYKSDDEAKILNDYARIALIYGNNDEALQYYKTAFKKLSDNTNIHLVHVIISNLIIRTVLDTGDRDLAETMLKQYAERIEKHSMSNKIEYSNCCISVYRQFGDYKKEYEIIKNDFFEIYPNLSTPQKQIFTASTFRMIMNGNYIYNWIDQYISMDYCDYDSLTHMEKLVVFKEYMGILTQVKYRVLRQSEPYKSLYDMIINFYETDALSIIDNMLFNTEAYDIYKYRNLVEHKLFILKLLKREKHIDESQSVYLDLHDTLFNAGLRVDALNSMMLFVDECASEYNTLILTENCSEPISYGEYIDKLPPPPAPIKCDDNLHLSYCQPNPLKICNVIPTKREIIAEKLETVIAEWNNLYNHPIKVQLAVHIAHFMMCLNRRAEAKNFYNYYKNSGVSKQQLADWLRQEVFCLEQEFE